MISFIEGKIVFKGEKFVVVDVDGIGYRVFAGFDVLRKAKKEEAIRLWTHLRVREDAMELYGFLEYPELEFFEALIQISGIGPKSALGVLSLAPLDTLKKAIAAGETTYLTKVSGIGRKIAEKIVLELRDKLGKTDMEGVFSKEDEDVLGGLHALGYSYQEARESLRQIPQDIEGREKRIKEALKILSTK